MVICIQIYKDLVRIIESDRHALLRSIAQVLE